MDWSALLAPVIRYSLLAALATVGAAYLVFRSGAAEGMAMLPGSETEYSLRTKLLFYGLGLVVWNLVGLAVLLP